MRVAGLFVAAFVYAAVTSASRAPTGPLEGCPEPSVTARALAQLQRADWQGMTIAKLQATWPTQLDGLDCEAKGCTSVWSKGRIIGGHCECCETFFFDVDDAAGKSHKEHLDVVVINYSASSREELVSVARDFAKAVGLAADKIDTVGQEASQEYSLAQGAAGEPSFLNLRWTRRGTVWTLNFYLSHDRRKPPDASGNGRGNRPAS
jgi:hypothetical protein